MICNTEECFIFHRRWGEREREIEGRKLTLAFFSVLELIFQFTFTLPYSKRTVKTKQFDFVYHLVSFHFKIVILILFPNCSRVRRGTSKCCVCFHLFFLILFIIFFIYPLHHLIQRSVIDSSSTSISYVLIHIWMC